MCHPPPFPTESLRGYVLRLSEENGYVTPWALLNLLGMKYSNGALSIDVLARITNRPICELRRIDTSQGSDHSRLLGQSVPPVYLRLRIAPNLCPECVATAGFIERHWDLAFMVGCPIHHHDLTSCCPECNRPLGWFRRGLLECSCGATIRAAGLPPIPDEEADLLDIIRCKALGLAPPGDTFSRLPTAELSAMNLHALLFIIRTIGKHRLLIDSPEDCGSHKRLVRAAARVLTSFPTNFYELLQDIGERLPHCQYQTGVRHQYDSIYRALFFKCPSVDYPERTDFLRIAFLDFLTNQNTTVAAGLFTRLRDSAQKRFIPVTNFGKRFGFGKCLMRRLVANKTIPTVTSWGNRRYTFVDMQRLRVKFNVERAMLNNV